MADTLALLSRATTMLASARTLSEVKSILDLAEAARTYSRAAKLGLKATNYASEIKLRAERKAGELLAELERKPGKRTDIEPHSSLERGSEYRTVLDDNDIAPTTAHRWQTVAAIPEQVFEEHIAETVAAEEELTTAGVLRLGHDEKQSEKPHVANNSGNSEWYTPSEYIEAARAVMGTIDLDPASSNEANTVVQATQYFTAATDGLAEPWAGHVFMNPPYAAHLIGRFTKKLADHYAAGDIPEAICLVNNATETEWFRALVDQATAVVFPTARIRFWKTGGETGSPLQGQAILYLGRRPWAFLKAFRQFGWAAWISNKGYPQAKLAKA
jgi:ParB family chromosome partitioning protein